MNPLRLDSAPGRTRLLAGLLLAGVFLAGGLAGAGLEHLRQGRFPGFPHRPLPLPPEMMQELGLSETQRQQIEAVFERHRPELDAIMKETFPRMREIMEQTDAEVNALLTPAQREKAEQLRAQFGPEPPPTDTQPGNRPLPPSHFQPRFPFPPGSGPEKPLRPASQPGLEKSDSAHSSPFLVEA